MNVSPQNPRSLFAALVLFFGWLNILFGAFILITGGREGLGMALSSLVWGAAFVGVIYYRERARKAG